MNQVLIAVAAIWVTLACAQALAVNPPDSSRIARRQLVDCMMKRMSADKVVSYNDASKACKDQLKAQNDKLASNAQVNPVNNH